MDGNERRQVLQSGSKDNRSNSRIRLCSPIGADATHNLATNNRGTQVSLTDIIGWADIRAVQENKQVIPVFGIPFQESFGFFLFQRAFKQPVTKLFVALDPA
jgi:hypothetical protein